MRAFKRALLPLLLLLSHSAVAQQGRVTGATMTWYGQYEVSSTKEVTDKRAAGGVFRTSNLMTRPTTNNDKIAIRPDVRFGFGYRLIGRPASAVVKVKHVRRFPPEGIVNPNTGQRFYFEERDLDVRIDRNDLFVGYLLSSDPNHPSILPGLWTFEVWHNNRKLVEKAFTLYRP